MRKQPPNETSRQQLNDQPPIEDSPQQLNDQPPIEDSPQQLNDQPPIENSPQKRFGRWTPLLILLTVTCLVRVAAVVALRDHLDADPDAYANLAVGLHDHGVLGFINNGDPVRPTALRPPLYPMLLAPFVSQGDV